MKSAIIFLIGLCLIGCAENLEEHIEYYPSGKIRKKVLIDKQNRAQGLAYEYYENGNLKFKRNNLNGKTNGIQEEYYSNGKIKAKGSFLNNIEIDSTYFYSKSGKLESIIIHDRGGKVLKEIFYYPNGKIREEKALLVGKETYVSARNYTPTGKVIKDFSEGSIGYANLQYSKSSTGNLLLTIDLKNNSYTDSVFLLVVKNFDFDFFEDAQLIRKKSFSNMNKFDIEVLNSDYVGERLNILIVTSRYEDKERKHSISKNFYIQLPRKGKMPENNILGIYPK